MNTAAYEIRGTDTESPVVPGVFNDQQKAQAYRDELRPLLQQVCDVVSRARLKDGLQIGFSLSPDQYGRQVIGQIDVLKAL